MKLRLVLLITFIAFSGIIYSQTILIHKVTDEIIIDGDLSDWKKPFSDPFVIHNSGAKASQKNVVSFSWNEDYLYIAYRSEDSKIVGSIKEKDSPIYNSDDLVEIFMDPDGDGQNYVEIGVNAFSANYDMLIQCVSPNCGGWKTQTNFTIIGMETVSKITAEGFCTEIKIPFSSLESIENGNFSKPKIGTKWKGNAFRIDYGNTTEYLALQAYKTRKFGFHKPKEFADFEFVE